MERKIFCFYSKIDPGEIYIKYITIVIISSCLKRSTAGQALPLKIQWAELPQSPHMAGKLVIAKFVRSTEKKIKMFICMYTEKKQENK